MCNCFRVKGGQNGDMTRDRALALIHEHLPEHAEKIAATLQASIRIRTSREAEDTILRQPKFGGLAPLPPEMPWPHWNASRYYESRLAYLKRQRANDGPNKLLNREIQRVEELLESGRTPLSFLAQIVLSELPSPQLLGLPRQGGYIF